MLDLKLDPVTHDLVVNDYAIFLIGSHESVRQNVKQRLLHFLGEWFLDLSAGTPWIESILIKGARQTQVEAILKARIIGTPGIRSLDSFSLAEAGERQLAVEFTATIGDNQTISDIVQVNV